MTIDNGVEEEEGWNTPNVGDLLFPSVAQQNPFAQPPTFRRLPKTLIVAIPFRFSLPSHNPFFNQTRAHHLSSHLRIPSTPHLPRHLSLMLIKDEPNHFSDPFLSALPSSVNFGEGPSVSIHGKRKRRDRDHDGRRRTQFAFRTRASKGCLEKNEIDETLRLSFLPLCRQE